MRWNYQPICDESISLLSQNLQTSRILAKLLLRSGISDPEEARRFLEPRLRQLDDPFKLTNLRSAVERIQKALENDEKIMVLGDYDVDGVTSTVLLVCLLERLGASPGYIVPRRLEEGYGLTRSAIDRVLAKGPIDLFITVDCGTNSFEEVAYLREKGIDVIIVDHHRSLNGIPEDCILINPHVVDEPDQPWTHLSAVGLVFKVAHGLLKNLRAENDPEASKIVLKEYLDLVAMGTIADLAPLHGENRILCKFGLRILRRSRRPGLTALLKISGVKTDEEVRPVDVSFRIGPRINACGRLDDASLSVKTLLSRDRDFCEKGAKMLDDFNRERQEIERRITVEAEQLKERELPDASGIILHGREWHAGVVGIVASRISRKYHRPTIVLGSEGELAKGSGRSVNGINLVQVLEECDDLLESWGGHPLAVGVSVREENIPAFQNRFDELVGEAMKGELLEPEIEIAAWLELNEINEELLRDLDLLHPFGQGHREPCFALREIVFEDQPLIFKENHFRFRIIDGDGRWIYGVAWKMADRIPPVDQPVDIVVRAYWNFFNNRKLLQLELIDWRLSK